MALFCQCYVSVIVFCSCLLYVLVYCMHWYQCLLQLTLHTLAELAAFLCVLYQVSNNKTLAMRATMQPMQPMQNHATGHPADAEGIGFWGCRVRPVGA